MRTRLEIELGSPISHSDPMSITQEKKNWVQFSENCLAYMFAKALSKVFTDAKRNHLYNESFQHFAEKPIRNECIFLTTEILKRHNHI